ncbi:hypothetical protein [Dyadobacter fanqingshengii]|uniref:Uncharacterized protein n=1 Tax=Dyadobacter fanqingshengii TaxID=2906443 RepID=A0A9X1P9D5_9BACT|nr:hypothetical protein [Dyadobacter fanqingshengii]MCF0040427.1 hypothetical protein [Dyadobacter fanqingshengii]USJ37831.1 hypothetical protein NFI81_08595 [Dyadobacter fanqingshengii]
MKSTISIYIISIGLLMLSCDDRNTATLAPEYLYDAGNQKVIKSIINNKKGTIAMLYGNDLALESASDSLPEPNIGAHFTLITWKQKPMPQWYGTKMNGEIYSIEHLKVVQRNETRFAFEYDFQTGKGDQPGEDRPDKEQRIAFITSQHAAVFP